MEHSNLKIIAERAAYLLDLTKYYNNLLIPYEYRFAIIEFLEFLSNIDRYESN